jgi:hypothetical protein
MGENRATGLLAKLQQAKFGTLGLSIPNLNEEARQGFLAKFLEQVLPDESHAERYRRQQKMLHEFREAQQSLPTPYQELGGYILVRGLASTIEKVLTDGPAVEYQRPVLGTLPTGQVNAITLRVPSSNDHLILFEWQLFTFALLFTKAIARALPIVGNNSDSLEFSFDEEDIRRKIQTDISVSGRFADVVLAYASTGLPSGAQPYLAEPQYQGISNAWCRAMELFVMGHEYAHVILGHLDGTQVRSVAQLEGAEELDYSWRQEYVADVVGWSLMMKASDGDRNAPFASLGAELFFGSLDVMDRAISLLRENDSSAASAKRSHPPNAERRANVRAAYSQFLQEDDARQGVYLCELLEGTIDLLWDSSIDLITDRRTQGLSAAPWWQ